MKLIYWSFALLLAFFSEAESGEQAQGRLLILDENGIRVEGVDVLIGDRLDSPFKGNLRKSSKGGELNLPKEWTQPLAVTLHKIGYVTATYLALKPGDHVLEIRSQLVSDNSETSVIEGGISGEEFQLQGMTSGYRILNGDGLVDFGLVMSTFEKRDLFNFDVSMVMSPSKDSIKLVGKDVKVPSNVALPTQSEKYVFNFNFDKPGYRLLFPTRGRKSVFLARGQFQLQPVIDGYFEGKELFELVNSFSIKGGSLAEANLEGRNTKLDINVNQMNFTQKKLIRAPKLPDTQIMIGLTMGKASNRIYPQDVKIFESEGRHQLQHASDSVPLLLAALKNKSEMKSGPGADRVSAALIPIDEKQSPNLLPLLTDPEIVSDTQVKLTLPLEISGLRATGGYLVRSKIIETEDSEKKVLLKAIPDRDLFIESWSDSIQIPQWPETEPSQHRTRWEITLLAETTATSASAVKEQAIFEPDSESLPQRLFHRSTHGTRASVTQSPSSK